jgi:hypothetical protein
MKHTIRLLVAGNILGFLLVIALVALFILSQRQGEVTRQSYLNGLYTVSTTIQSAASLKSERLTIYMKRAKGIILRGGPNGEMTDMSDTEINAFLLKNFELSEQTMWNPYLLIAYASVESPGFKKGAVSVAGAIGIVQFMPATMKLALGDQYIPGMEYDPVWSVIAWYKYAMVLNEAVKGDLIWLACSYMAPTAIQWKNLGRTPEKFMEWMEATTPNGRSYPWDIQARFDWYSSDRAI